MNSDFEYARGKTGDRALVAAFRERQSAHDAATNLRENGFHKVWIGVTRGDTLTSEDESLGAKIGRFFRGETDGESLTDTLVKHGVSAAEAERIALEIEPSDVLLTVDGSNHPERAAQIVENYGGDVISGESFVYTQINWSPDDERLGSELLGYEDPDFYARGQRVDDEGVTRLREERLAASNVPTIREDYFILATDGEDELDHPSHGRRSAGGAVGTQHRNELES